MKVTTTTVNYLGLLDNNTTPIFSYYTLEGHAGY